MAARRQSSTIGNENKERTAAEAPLAALAAAAAAAPLLPEEAALAAALALFPADCVRLGSMVTKPIQYGKRLLLSRKLCRSEIVLMDL